MTDTIHSRIRQARIAKGLTQRVIAERIGVTAQAVNQWERSTEPSNDNLKKLADVLDISMDVLLGRIAQTEIISRLDQLFPEKKIGQDVPMLELCELRSQDDLGLTTQNRGILKIIQSRFNVSKKSAAFVMRGDRMHPVIFENDVVIIDANISTSPGDFVVVYIRSIEVTEFLKFQFEGSDHCALVPINPHYRSYRFTFDEWQRDVQILGTMSEFARSAVAVRRGH